METRTIRTLDELSVFAEEILSVLPQKRSAHVLALKGDLGTGKTAFVQAFADLLGVKEHVVSPTFVIMRSYGTAHDAFTKLVHIDAYRVEDEEEMRVLKIPELFYETGTIICIEWAKRIPSLIPKEALLISFTINDDNSRTATYGE